MRLIKINFLVILNRQAKEKPIFDEGSEEIGLKRPKQ